MLYGVYHLYDILGSKNEPVRINDLVAVFQSLQQAQRFVKKYQKPHIYNEGYPTLFMGILIIQKLPDIGKIQPQKYMWLD